MRALYEIDADIESLIDIETGEIMDLEKLDALQMERTEKITNVLKAIKNGKAESDMLAEEIKKLQARKKAIDNKNDGLKLWTYRALNGEKFKNGAVSCYTKITPVIVLEEGCDVNSLPSEYKRISVEPDKVALKEALTNGEIIEGVSLMDKASLVVR